jgi:hypothetical protein
MGIGQRTRCFQKLWSNRLPRIKEGVEKKPASDFTVNADNKQDVPTRVMRDEPKKRSI